MAAPAAIVATPMRRVLARCDRSVGTDPRTQAMSCGFTERTQVRLRCRIGRTAGALCDGWMLEGRVRDGRAGGHADRVRSFIGAPVRCHLLRGAKV